MILSEMSGLLDGFLYSHINAIISMNCNNFGDPLTFHVVPSSSQTFYVSNTLVYDQISAELMTFPSASAVLCV